MRASGRAGGGCGARMRGGGGGGPILCILETGREEELIPRIQKLCVVRLGRENSCDVLVVKEAGSGARAY